MSDLVVARTSGVVMVDGRRYPLRRGVTIARVGHPLVAAKPRLWEPLTVHFDVDPVGETEMSDETAVDENGASSEGDEQTSTSEEEVAAVSNEDEATAEEVAASEEASAATAQVEQATAAPGELRNVRPAKKAAKKAARPAADDGK